MMTRDEKESMEDVIVENHQGGSWETSQKKHERKKKQAESQDAI